MWHDFHVVLDGNLPGAMAHRLVWPTQMHHTAFGAIGEISTPEKEGRQGQKKSNGRPYKFVRGWQEFFLTHWGRVTHICVSKLTINGLHNGLSPGRRQAIIWTNSGILLIGPSGTNFSEILIGIQTFSFKKMHLKMSFAKWRPFCLGLNVLMLSETVYWHWLGFPPAMRQKSGNSRVVPLN